MALQQHDFATRPALVRRAIHAHESWIEEKLGVPVEETVIFESRLNLSQIGIDKVLGCSGALVHPSRATRRLRPLVKSAEMPAGWPPILSISKVLPSTRDLRAALSEMERGPSSQVEWEDCPIALQLHTLTTPVVVMNVHYHAGPSSDVESVSPILIARRDCTQEVIRLLGDLDSRDSRARLHTLNGSTRTISLCQWDDLVFDSGVASLLRDDFEAFWEREAWFREKKIPFRRGYLLHGPPGNGKSTAVRAMMSSRGLSAFTLRLFDERTGDSDLDDLFDAALKERPAMVLLEDLDRAFPRDGKSGTNISLQYLLNCLDGVATGQGIVVVASANEPALLDPAILRRPGRFDRVVHFPNPGPTLRAKYFSHMNSSFQVNELEPSVEASDGFSFVQCREAYILAAQTAFQKNDDIRAADLLAGIHRLRQTMVVGSMRGTQAGFCQAPMTEVTQ
jgi:hypothetical protein